MAEDMLQLEINDYSIKAGEVVKNRNRIVLKSAGSTPITRSIYVSQAEDIVKLTEASIKKLVSDSQTNSKYVNIILPDNHSYSRIISMPFLTEKELISAIRFHADQFIPIPIDKVNLDIEVIKENKKTKQIIVLLVAASKSLIEKVVSIVETCGLSPHSVESQASASIRFFEHAISTTAKQLVEQNIKKATFLYIGSLHSSIYLFDVGEIVPLQIHTVPIGMEIFKRDIRSNLNIDDQKINKLIQVVGLTGKVSDYNIEQAISPVFDEFVSELRRYFVSLKDKSSISPDRIFVLGEGNKLAGLPERLSSKMNIQFSRFNPQSLMEANKVVEFFKNDISTFVPIMGGGLKSI